jgi:hypothetical protein
MTSEEGLDNAILEKKQTDDSPEPSSTPIVLSGTLVDTDPTLLVRIEFFSFSSV